jgi:hypothetical protein
MNDRKLAIGLLVFVFAGGCVLTPYDLEEEAVDSVSSEVSTAQRGQETEGATNNTLTPLDPVTGAQTAPSTVDTRMNSDPTKPQPDPWDGMRWRSLSSSR